ncbi:acyl-CoA thioesterase II [Microbacterium sp. SORGH_AS_0888]|uniref:acyl-CoA thioesterase n=1 Tax=Microbacterium sp. SORGH_AS_0888 TaxID=3041791 RepID=UPI002784C9F5|nr:acyl-CoA thioesterase domain-containing protein [Microbacterium sp. SORGH_AS_0888]MDQ1128720.1 acyl-CoA thioesterase-2 [Microbacterium sp. SORGH_AS_0888]
MSADLPDAPDAETFLRAIALAETTPTLFDRAFEATPQYVPWPKAYGGDAVAQSLAAAWRTVGADRVAHSAHSTFLRPVEVLEPVRYEVELTRDGRGYSTRYVRGIQRDRLVFASTVSFQVPEHGPRHAPAAHAGGSPDRLPTTAQAVAAHDDDAARYWGHGRSFDHRHVEGDLYGTHTRDSSDAQNVWLRAFSRLPDDPVLHRLAIAYVCDYSILEPSLRALGATWRTPGLQTASLDHAIWFHADARADDWLLYAQQSAGVQSGRALNLGRFFTGEGALVATVAQEGMVRLPDRDQPCTTRPERQDVS